MTAPPRSPDECPKGHMTTRVLHRWRCPGYLARRHRCNICGARWTSYQTRIHPKTIHAMQRVVDTVGVVLGTVRITPGTPRPNPNASLSDRIAARYTPDATTGCWVWIGAVDQAGYGRFSYRRAESHRRGGVGAHRAVYELLVGPIAPGMTLDHLCKNTRCVNPQHLEQVTNLENIRRSHRP